MERKFTEGNWRVLNSGPHWNNPSITNYNIAWSEDGELVAEHVYEEADAVLMSAAKELLSALIAMEAKAGKQNWNDHYPEQLAAAQAAIAKATGADHA